jgi:hypothetical protein
MTNDPNFYMYMCLGHNTRFITQEHTNGKKNLSNLRTQFKLQVLRDVKLNGKTNSEYEEFGRRLPQNISI